MIPNPTECHEIEKVHHPQNGDGASDFAAHQFDCCLRVENCQMFTQSDTDETCVHQVEADDQQLIHGIRFRLVPIQQFPVEEICREIRGNMIFRFVNEAEKILA